MVMSLEKRRAHSRQWQADNRPHMNLYSLWYNCKLRANKKQIDFLITRDDIKIPKLCPILGMKLEHGFDKGRDNSPSVDRIDRDKGYVPGNIQVISNLANRMKNSGTLQQCILLGQWAERRLAEVPS